MADVAMTMENPVRRPTPQLMTGIAILPVLFAWFTLRKGYATRIRAVSLGYAAAWTIAVIVIMAQLSAGPAEKPVTAPIAAVAKAPPRPATAPTPQPGLGFGVEPEPQGGNVANPFTS